MYKPFGNRCIVRIMKHYITDENGKSALGDDGTPIYEPEQEAKVLSSNIPEIKKGMIVVPIIRGGVPLRKMEDKKSVVISLDIEDIYAVEI